MVIDSLLLAVLLTVIPVEELPADPYIFTEQNEAVQVLLDRTAFALDHYSEFGRLDDRGITYVRLGEPDWTEKGLRPKADLDLSLSRGKPPELINTEIWGYAGLKEPLIFQEKPGGGFSSVRQPDQLVIYASQVQSKINYEYDYGKEKLAVNYAIATYYLLDCPDSLEIAIDLILPQNRLDSLFLWRLAVQEAGGKVVSRDSLEFVALRGSEEVISKSLYVESQLFASEAGIYTLTARSGYVLTLEVVSKDGKRGNLQQLRIEL